MKRRRIHSRDWTGFCILFFLVTALAIAISAFVLVLLWRESQTTTTTTTTTTPTPTSMPVFVPTADSYLCEDGIAQILANGTVLCVVQEEAEYQSLIANISCSFGIAHISSGDGNVTCVVPGGEEEQITVQQNYEFISDTPEWMNVTTTTTSTRRRMEILTTEVHYQVIPPFHDELPGVDPNEHIDHRQVHIFTAGALDPLEDGTDLTVNKTISLDIHSKTLIDDVDMNDEILVYDASQSEHRKTSISSLPFVVMGGGGGPPFRVDAQEASSTSSTSTTSTSYVDMADMSLTTANTNTTTYQIFFNTVFSVAGVSLPLSSVILNIGGVDIITSERAIDILSIGANHPISTFAFAFDVAPGTEIKVRYKTTLSTLTAKTRTLGIYAVY